MKSTIALAILLLPACSFGQSKTKGAAPARAAFPAKTVNLKTDHLGPAFVGHSIKALVSEFASIAPKSEFETTEDFNKRSTAFLAKSNRQYVFVIPSKQAVLKYDADTQIMTATVASKHQYDVDDLPDGVSRAGINLKTDEITRRTYVGTTAWNRKATVTEVSLFDYGVLLVDRPPVFLNEEYDTYSAVVETPMNATMAKNIKSSIGIALIATAVNAMPVHGHYRIEPKISSPYDITVDQWFLAVRPDELWMFDKRTGAILEKFAE